MNDDAPLDWRLKLLADLRAFSAELLEAGLAPSTEVASAPHDGSPMRFTLQAVDRVCQRLPDLLRALEADESFLVPELLPSPTPRQALQSRRPQDYAWHDERLLPRRWLRPEPAPELRLEPLRWLAGYIDSLRQQLQRHQSRLEKAHLVRAGQTDYAQQDQRRLDEMSHAALSARHRLELCLSTLYRRAGRTFAGSPRLPHPFPRSASWHGLRREVLRQTQGMAQQIALWLHATDGPTLTMAKLPYLYQRWCGLQVLRAAKALGWHSEGDVVGALLLGGVIGLRQTTCLVEFWIEPRLGTAQAERIGWRSAKPGGELTPDFLFVCGPPGQRDAFVSDPTLATGRDQREDRNRIARSKDYRQELAGTDPILIAGVTSVRKPLRSWAMAPIRSTVCYLGEDREGQTGIVSMDVKAEDFSGLKAWLADVFAHARRVERDAAPPSAGSGA